LGILIINSRVEPVIIFVTARKRKKRRKRRSARRDFGRWVNRRFSSSLVPHQSSSSTDSTIVTSIVSEKLRNTVNMMTR
jgi:hypothetical protein